MKALTAPDSLDEVLEITGGEALSAADQVQVLERVLGREIRCAQVPVESAVEGMIQSGVPAPVASAVGASFAWVRDGHGDAITDTVRRVLGREPMTFEQWALKNAQRFA